MDWCSHKLKKSEVCYEMAISMLGGDICWISGPHQAGLNNDLDIFCTSLATFLEPFERVEADDGYFGEAPLRVKFPASVTIEKERLKMMNSMQSRQETINKRFKLWGILQQVYRNNLIHRRDVFAAICVVTQLAIENGDDIKIK